MESDSIAVRADSLTVSYGKSRGIEGVSLSIERGSVTGLVGANGAGKSTFMRTLMGFIRATSGSLDVLGLPAARESVEIRRHCTYLPGEFVVPSRLTGHQVIDRFTFTRRGMEADRVESLARTLDVDLTRRVGDLSKGNKQKLGLVLAFAPPADLIVLDEPTSGLDPVLQRVFAGLVKQATDEGKTVLLSSHVMSEVQEIAAQVVLLREGRVAFDGKLSEVLAQSRRRAVARPTDHGEAPAIAAALVGIANVDDIRQVDGSVEFACQGSVDQVLKLLATYDIAGLELAHADLEDAFFPAGGSVFQEASDRHTQDGRVQS
ncbi:MAG: ABC transporter ATP-binding protein [Candidatus Nanopelagicales bacterium]